MIADEPIYSITSKITTTQVFSHTKRQSHKARFFPLSLRTHAMLAQRRRSLLPFPCGFVALWLCGFVALWLCGFGAPGEAWSI